MVHLDLRLSPRIFEKIRNGPNAILWGWGETDSSKKPEAKNLVTLSLGAAYLLHVALQTDRPEFNSLNFLARTGVVGSLERCESSED